MIGYSPNNDQQLELPLATYPEKNPLSGLDSRLISLDSIPLDPEFQAENIMKQQEYTQKVAPIARALLHAHQTQEYIGDKTIVRFDGQHLSIQDKCNQQYKMIAEYQGFDGETKQTLWKSIDLPLGSPGLSEGEVKQWTSVQTIQYIKGKMTANQSVSSSQPALVS
jgi:hypothetical protein